MKSILDPSFRYVPSTATDLRKTFSRIRREMQKAGAHDSRSATPDVLRVRRFSRSRDVASQR